MKTFLEALTPEEEKRCLMQMQLGDKAAKEEFILRNMRLVAHVVKKYQSPEEEQEDLISIGTIGLLKAVDTFDMEFANRFATYAIRCIENELLMYFRRTKRSRMEVSLYEPIGTDREGREIHLMDVLLVDTPDVAGKMEQEAAIGVIMGHLDQVLSPREAEIICKRYGLRGMEEQTQKEIAKAMGISRSYVSRIEKRALEKLAKLL